MTESDRKPSLTLMSFTCVFSEVRFIHKECGVCRESYVFKCYNFRSMDRSDGFGSRRNLRAFRSFGGGCRCHSLLHSLMPLPHRASSNKFEADCHYIYICIYILKLMKKRKLGRFWPVETRPLLHEILPEGTGCPLELQVTGLLESRRQGSIEDS